jgi:hypothetical protein
MKTQHKVLLAAGLSLGILASPRQSFALGGGGPGANVGSETVTLSDVGPLSGKYSFSGGVDGFGSIFNNATPNLFPRNNNTSYSIGEAVIQIHKADGWLHFTYWGGAWQTPTMGITSDYGAFNSLARLGSSTNPLPTPTFKWWFTVQPSKYWSISGGEMPSLEGVEIGFDFMNPTFFVSELNNVQATPAYGPQLNLYYGPATFNLQWSDSYHTDRHNMVSAALTYNLNKDGSDNFILFGHTNLGHTGNPGVAHAGVGLGFSEANSSLIGGGVQIVTGPWTFLPEAQIQWLPKSSVTAASGDPRPLSTYYGTGGMIDVTYQFTKKWSLTAQPQFYYQNSNKKDPNQNLFGNWLQFDSTPGPGTFSPGTKMYGLQISPTWQEKNFFIRPTAAFTHISGFAAGTGYGARGNAANQIVALVEAGFLIGKY